MYLVYINELEGWNVSSLTLGENEFSLSLALSFPLHDKWKQCAQVKKRLRNKFIFLQPVKLEIWKLDSLLNPEQFNNKDDIWRI